MKELDLSGLFLYCAEYDYKYKVTTIFYDLKG